jgi:hypothetical protein
MSDFDGEQQNTMSLGEKLQSGIQNLWSTVNTMGTVQDHQGQELQALKNRMEKLESEVHGLKVSKGMAKAAKQKMEEKLDAIKSVLQ